MPRNIEDEVRRILASMDEQQSDQAGAETEIPEKETTPPPTQQPEKEEIFDVYTIPTIPDSVFIVRVNEQIIDSVAAEAEPNTQPIQSEDIQHPLPGDKASERIAYGILSFSILMLLSIILLQLYFLLNPPTVTVTLIPKSQQITLTGTLQLGRVLTPITLSQTATAQATGRGHQDARNATGTITFYNGQLTQQFVPAGTILTSASGIQIATNEDATIPAADLTANPPVIGQVTVTAHAVYPGVQGNIQAYSINQPCCSSVVAKNLSNFTSGQDERNFTIVTQADIDNAAIPLKATLSESMQAALQAQHKPQELVKPFPCSPTTTADHHPGEEATQVKVTVSETCSAVAYNEKTLHAQVTALLSQQAVKKLGPGYSLLGTPQINVTQAGAQNTKVVVSFSSSGLWVYALADKEQEYIKKIIAGKTKEKAMQLLLSLPGIESASLQSSGFGDDSRIPKNLSNIHLTIIYGV